MESKSSSLPGTGGPDQSSPRITSLDSIRGIAALTVVLGHAYLVFPERVRSQVDWTLHAWATPWPWLKLTPLRLLTQGPAAVILFFCLSGLVLAMPFMRHEQPRYGRFLIKRFCRIYVPFAAAIAIAAALYAVVRPTSLPALSNWFNAENWAHPLTGATIMRHLAMTGFKIDRDLDDPIWSLVHEMRISIIFPWLILMVFRFGALRSMVAAFVLHVACLVALTHFSEDTSIGTALATGKYLVFFFAGISIAMHRELCQAWVWRQSNRARTALWICSFAFMLFPAGSELAPLAYGIGAVGVIVLSLASPGAERVLSMRPSVWLGRISYSLYLFHVVILMAAVHLLFDHVALPIIIVGSIATSVIVATLAHRAIELPAMALGRRLAGQNPEGQLRRNAVWPSTLSMEAATGGK